MLLSIRVPLLLAQRALGWACSDVEYITTPSISGPSSGISYEVLWFYVNDAVSSEGHPLQYQFNWDFHEGPNDWSQWSTDNPKDNQYPLEGIYNITVHARCQQHPERVSYWSEPHTVQIAYTQGSIAGTVTDAVTSGPLPNVHVRVLQGTTEVDDDFTDLSGQYAITGLDPGSYDVEASLEAYYTETVNDVSVVAGQETTVDIALGTLPTTGSITGVVTDAGTGLPIDNAFVRLLQDDVEIWSGYTPVNGEYNTPTLDPGLYVIEASANCFETATVSDITVEAGVTTTQNMALEESPFPPVVYLRDANGNPISENTVFDLYRVENNPPFMTEHHRGLLTTDALGRITIPSNWFYPGDSVKISRLCHGEPAKRHQAILPYQYKVYLDNATFDLASGAILYDTLTCLPEQVITLDHTTLKFDLLVSVEWDAPSVPIIVGHGLREAWRVGSGANDVRKCCPSEHGSGRGGASPELFRRVQASYPGRG